MRKLLKLEKVGYVKVEENNVKQRELPDVDDCREATGEVGREWVILHVDYIIIEPAG